MDGRIRGSETVMNLVWVVAGIGIIATSIQTGVWGPGGPGSGFLGLIAGVAIAGGGAVLMITREQAGREFRFDAGAARRILAVIGGLAVMALVIPWLGFILTAVLTLIVLLRLLEKQSWVAIVFFSIFSTLAVYAVFDRLLGSTLPTGPLGF